MSWQLTKELQRKENAIADLKVKCKCGCVTIMTPKTDWCICRWCQKKLYRTPQIKFKYEMEEKLKK